jgi:hypothetical protein
MAAQVIMPQKQDDTNGIFQLGGAIAGGVLAAPGGPGAIAGGAALGSQLGGLAGSTFNAPKAGPQPVQSTTASNSSTDSNAIRRRLETMQADPVNQLSAAKSALAYQPPDVQKQYMDTVNQALILAQRDQRRGQA